MSQSESRSREFTLHMAVALLAIQVAAARK